MKTKMYLAKPITLADGKVLGVGEQAVTIDLPEGLPIDGLIRGLNNGFFSTEDPKKAAAGQVGPAEVDKNPRP